MSARRELCAALTLLASLPAPLQQRALAITQAIGQADAPALAQARAAGTALVLGQIACHALDVDQGLALNALFRTTAGARRADLASGVPA